MGSNKVERPDYSYWLMVRIWSPYEASHLMLGIDPHSIPLLENCSNEQLAAKKQQDKLWRILASAAEAGEFGKTWVDKDSQIRLPTILNLDWIAWAKRNNVNCEEELLYAAEKFHEQESSKRDDIHPRRETTLLRVIGALLHELKETEKKSEASVIRHIDDLFGHIPGIAKSTLQKDFADAKRRLREY